MAESKRVVRTRRDISRALIDLLLEKNFDSITIVDICNKALVTRATFYKYFEDKYHLISCIIDDYKDKIINEKLEHYNYTDPEHLFMYLAQISIDLIEKNRSFLQKIYSNCNNPKLREQIISIIEYNLHEFLKRQKPNIEFCVPTKIVSKFYSSGIVVLALSYLEDPENYKKEDILEFFKYSLTDKRIYTIKNK